MDDVTYHSADFEWQDLADECEKENDQKVIPFLTREILQDRVDGAVRNWDIFHRRHGGKAYKPRNYILKEFPEIAQSQVLLEVGCGHGSCILPIFESLPKLKGFACDFSAEAIAIFRQTPLYETVQDRCDVFVHDITKDSLTPRVQPQSVDVVVMVFVLSAISPSEFTQTLDNIYQVYYRACRENTN